VIESRERLRRHCRARFEPGNRRLIEALGWDLEELVPGPDDDRSAERVTLDELDELWAGPPDPIDREPAYLALAELARARGRADR
jgi:hypothetical protein